MRLRWRRRLVALSLRRACSRVHVRAFHRHEDPATAAGRILRSTSHQQRRAGLGNHRTRQVEAGAQRLNRRTLAPRMMSLPWYSLSMTTGADWTAETRHREHRRACVRDEALIHADARVGHWRKGAGKSDLNAVPVRANSPLGERRGGGS